MLVLFLFQTPFSIDYNEWLAAGKNQKILEKINKLTLGPESFSIFDYDGSGTVDVDEFRQVLKNLGIKLTDEEFKQMIDIIDADGNGEIDYEEFVEMMKR